MPAKVFALLLNYNNPDDTLACARSLLSSKGAKLLNLVVIDNGPSNLEKYFSKHIPSAHYLRSPSNIGFAAGNNQGMRYATERDATHILIINPDVTVESDFLLPLLATFDEFPKAGIVAPAHTHPQGDKTVYGLGGSVNWTVASFPHADVARLNFRKPRRYDLLTFACVLIDSDVIKRVGGMDERYFLYIEDVDYCLTVQQAGYQLYLNPQVVVSHKTSSSFDNPVNKLRYSFASHLQFIHKWYSFPGNILPFLYQLYFYLHLYLLWSAKQIKSRIMLA